MRQIQNKSFGRKLFSGLVALVLPILPGCFTGGSVEPVVGFGARCLGNTGIKYNSATSIGVRGKAKTKSKVEVEAEVSTYNTVGGAGIVNHDVTATEVSGNVLYPIWSNSKGDVYVGVGATSTSQTVTETATGFPGSSTFDQSETDARAFVGGRLKAGKGNIDARVSAGSRGTTASLGYEFTF